MDGFSLVMPNQVVDLFTCLQGFVGRESSVTMWKMMPLCLMWCLWMERNERCFEDHECSLEELRIFFVGTLCFQAKVFVSNETIF